MAKNSSQEIAVNVTPAPPAPVSMFAGLLDGAIVIDGGDLLNEGLQDELIGVPFVLTKVEFREADTSQPGAPWKRDYVTVTTVVGDEYWMRKRRVNLESKPFDPEDTVLFNDGSTGVRRQIVEILEGMGVIQVEENSDDLVKGGASYESSFDKNPEQWHEIHGGELKFNENGHGDFSYEFNPPVFCKRGLRTSDYTNEYAKDATTRYIA